MAFSNRVYIGIQGAVIALDTATGTALWATELKGGDFVNVVHQEDAIFAATKGELFCLDPGTGTIRWHNRLKGWGTGLVTIATRDSGAAATVAEKRRREQAAASQAAVG